MKVIIHGVERNLIPYKGNPQKWWDGENEDTIYNFSDLVFPTYTTYATETVLKTKVNISISGSITKKKKPASKTKSGASKKTNSVKV